MTKVCRVCKVNKSLEEYHARKGAKDGRRNECIPCRLLHQKTRHPLVKEHHNAKCREYDAAHLDEKLKYNKQYYADHREQRIKDNYAYQKAQRKLSNNYALADGIRCRLYQAIRKGQKKGSAVKDLGCTIPFLREYLQARFKPGMTWDNWTRDGWHIDHVKPLASFNLEDREQFLEAVHYTNLQPLWASENIHKSAKLD